MGQMRKKKRARQSRRRGYDSSYSDSSSNDGMSTEETPPTRSSDIRAMIEEAISKTISKEAKGIKLILKELKEESNERHNQLKEESNERHNQLKEGINEIHNQLKKLIENHIVPRTQLEHLNGSSGDGSPAPRSEPNQMQPPTFSLKIESEVGDSVEKGKSITIKVKMYDGGNPIGEKLKDGRPHPLASAKVMMVVLDGKFNDNRSSWSKADFKESIKTSTAGDVNQGIVSNCVFYLDGGTGRHSGATITENSGNRKVKLGVMVLPDDSYGEYKNERVLEGVSKESFLVRDPPRTRKKQKEVVEHFRSPLAEQAPVGCGQEWNGPTLNIPGQLQLQADTNMPSSSSTPRDNTLGADQQLSQQPSSFSEGHHHISAGVQTPVISGLMNQTMHSPDGGGQTWMLDDLVRQPIQMDRSLLEDLMHQPIQMDQSLLEDLMHQPIYSPIDTPYPIHCTLRNKEYLPFARHCKSGKEKEPVEGFPGGGRAECSGQREVAPKMEDKPTVRKKPVPSDSPRVEAESGTCNVCYAPCSSCLHRNLVLADSNMYCGSSQTCCTRSETKNSSFVHSEKGLHTKGGENDDEFSATSSHASYSENGGNKAMARSYIGADSEVDMPAKRRKLLNHDARSLRVECQDDSNSCVTGVSAAGKPLLDKKKDKLSTSASSRDLTVKGYKDSSVASHNRLRNYCVEDSTEKKRSDVHVMHPSSSDRSVPADSPSVTKKLLRTQSSVSASQGLSPKRRTHGFGNSEDNLAHQPYEKASLSNNNKQHSPGGKLYPAVIGGDKHGMLTSCSTSNRNKVKVGSSSEDLENGTPCSRNGSQEHADIQSNDAAKRNDNDKRDKNQDCSMDISSGRKLNTQNDVMTDWANSEGLIDVNVCDICGDVGREYLLATCTRCLEGAEHTYCMRVKLDKVPVGEWLCEECQIKEDQNKTRSYHGASTVNILDGKNQNSESTNNPKTLEVVVTNLVTKQITCGTPITDHSAGNNQKLHLVSTDPEARQVKCAPTVEKLDAKNKNLGSMANRKKLQVVTSDMEARPSTSGTLTAGSLDKKNKSSEVLLNRKKLRVATDMESPLSSEGLRSTPKSCKIHTENTSSPNPRLFKTESPRKHDAFSCENSFKKSNKGSLKSHDNAPVRTVQTVKSSLTLSRSYSLGSMATVKAPVPSPRGLLSKQLSFNNSNNEPKVKQLAEGVVSKLKPTKHSPKGPRENGPIRKVMKSRSFTHDGSVCKDSSSLKQKQSFHLSQNEKSRILKMMKEKNLLERKASFNLQKPNIPSSPRPDSSMKSGDRKIEQDSPRPGPSMLKCSKKPGNTEKQQSSISSKSENQCITVHPTSIGVVSVKDASAAKTSDPSIPMEIVKKDGTNDGAGEASFILVKNDNEITKPEVHSTPCVAMTYDSDLQDMVPRASASEDLTPKVGQRQQNILESTGNDSSKNADAVETSEDILAEGPHGPLMAHNPLPPEDELNKPNLKQQDFVDQSSTTGNPFRALVIPEQTYTWQGIFEVSRSANSPEIYDGIQAHLSTCASPKALEVVKQLPQRIQLAEVPRRFSWPLQFKKVKPSEDNIALFFFAKDVESYERAYGKLLENMLIGDLSLTTNISGIELLIFPSDKLPEKIQRWNGLLYFWGVFYAKKANNSTELLVTGTDHCPLQPITGPVNQLVSSPKVPQSLGIDLNECPDDELYDPAVSFGLETEKSGASEDHKTLLWSKHEDASAVPYETHFPTSSKVGGLNIKADYPSDTIGGTGTAGRDSMGGEESFSQNEAPCCVKQHAGAITSISDEISAKKQAHLPFTEVSLQHSRGPKLSFDPSESIPRADFVLLDSGSSHKRQKTSSGKHSTCSFGDELLTSKCFSKIHALPAGPHTPLDDAQYIYGGPADPGSPTKPISDTVIHVLSSDDEDSPEPSTSLNKASLKAEGCSSPLSSLSPSTAAKQNNLAGSDTGDDGSLSLSLGLPGVVRGNQAFEMQQFLPEKPGINTSLLL